MKTKKPSLDNQSKYGRRGQSEGQYMRRKAQQAERMAAKLLAQASGVERRQQKLLDRGHVVKLMPSIDVVTDPGHYVPKSVESFSKGRDGRSGRVGIEKIDKNGQNGQLRITSSRRLGKDATPKVETDMTIGRSKVLRRPSLIAHQAIRVSGASRTYIPAKFGNSIEGRHLNGSDRQVYSRSSSADIKGTSGGEPITNDEIVSNLATDLNGIRAAVSSAKATIQRKEQET